VHTAAILPVVFSSLLLHTTHTTYSSLSRLRERTAQNLTPCSSAVSHTRVVPFVPVPAHRSVPRRAHTAASAARCPGSHGFLRRAGPQRGPALPRQPPARARLVRTRRSPDARRSCTGKRRSRYSSSACQVCISKAVPGCGKE